MVMKIIIKKIKNLIFYVFLKIFSFLINYKNFIENRYLLKQFIKIIRFFYGNTSWTANSEYICLVIGYIINSNNRNIIELGSGLTTIIFSLISKKYKIKYFAIENNNIYYQHMNRLFDRLNIDKTNIQYTPLKNYGDYYWYDIKKLKLVEESLNLVICDGPPQTTIGGRFGLVNLINKLTKNGLIILDDANKDKQKNLLDYIHNNYKNLFTYFLNTNTAIIKWT